MILELKLKNKNKSSRFSATFLFNSNELMITKASVFDMKVKVMFILQFLEDVTIGFLVKVIATIEDFKTQTIVLKESVGCFKAILPIEVHSSLPLFQVIAFFI